MKKKNFVTAVITTCLALCAAVWLQNETVKETPALNEMPVATAPEATIADSKKEVETAPPAEKEKTEIPQQEQTREATPEPKSTPAETTTAPEVQSTPEPAPVPEVSYKPTPEQAVERPAAQTTIEPQPGDMVYVPGFGWLEIQGPNHAEYAEDMYENGNKIGSMG